MKITKTQDAQHTRYTTRFGTLVISAEGKAFYIPKHTPHISIPLSRKDAANGLRTRRKHQ